MPSDKKQLYLLILWIPFAAKSLFLAFGFFLISQSTVSHRLPTKKNSTRKTFCTQCHQRRCELRLTEFPVLIFHTCSQTNSSRERNEKKNCCGFIEIIALYSYPTACISMWHKNFGWKSTAPSKVHDSWTWQEHVKTLRSNGIIKNNM